jgi:hypothetical protein
MQASLTAVLTAPAWEVWTARAPNTRAVVKAVRMVDLAVVTAVVGFIGASSLAFHDRRFSNVGADPLSRG